MAPYIGNENSYDIVVVGGGPGGYVAAARAARLGKKVALVEKEHLGGTCLNEGCIPTKALLSSAQILEQTRDCSAFGVTGVDTSGVRLDMRAVQQRKQNIVSQLQDGIAGLLKKSGVTVYQGQGVLRDAHTVVVNDQQLSAEYVIIATGSQTKSLPIPIDSQMRVMGSKEMLDCTELPASAVIIGGGVIGIEFAHFLSEAGVSVTVVEYMDKILPTIDDELGAFAARRLKQKGIKIHTGARVQKITADAVIFEKSGVQSDIKTDMVLMAVGREPRLTGIDAHGLGIRLDAGAIVTDETLKTSVDNIYAIGDVNGKSMLAHTASMEGIVAAENICGNKSVMDYGAVPSVVYIRPEIASVGLTEAEAKKRYGMVKVGKYYARANGKAKVEGDDSGFVKVVAEATYGEVVGVHLYCPHATEIIAEAALCMRLEGTMEEVAKTIHPHPSISEMLRDAMDVDN